MTEPKPKQTRPYVVVAVDVSDPPNPAKREGFTKLGVVEAGDAEGACVAAMEAHGLPEGVTKCIAVPVNNWNACKVEEETRPRFSAKRMSAMPEKDAAEAEPTPAAEPGE